MKRWQQLLLSAVIIILFVLTEQAFAYIPEKGNVNALFGPYIYKTNFSDAIGTGANSPILGDFGLIVDGDVNESGSLELGVFHLHKLFYRTTGGQSVVQGTEMIQIEMGYRKWINSFLSAGLSLYSSYSLGDPKYSHNDFGPGLTPNTSALETTLYGLDFSVQAEVWRRGRFSVFVDGSYCTQFNPKQDEKADLFGAMIGLRYFVQAQEIREKKPNEIETN